MNHLPLAESEAPHDLLQAATELRRLPATSPLASFFQLARDALSAQSVSLWLPGANGQLRAQCMFDHHGATYTDRYASATRALVGSLLAKGIRWIDKAERDFEEFTAAFTTGPCGLCAALPVMRDDSPGLLVVALPCPTPSPEKELFLHLLCSRLESLPSAGNTGNMRQLGKSHLMLADDALRDIFYFAPTAMILSESETARPIAANHHALTLLGIPEDLSDLKTSDFWLDPDERVELIRQVLVSGFVRGYRARLRRVDGRDFWARISSTRIDYQGKAAVMSSVTDVSDIVATEEVLHRTQQTLNTLLEASPFPLVVTRLDTGVVRYCNRKAAEMFEISPAGLIGHTAPEFYANPADRSRFVEKLRATGAVEGFVARLKTGEGEPFWAILNARTLDLNGEPVFMVAFADVTKQKDREAELQNLAFRDALTGACNRRYLSESAASEIARSERSGRPLVLALLDIDHFKQLNDDFGHKTGDDVLCEFVRVIQGMLRKSDIFTRYGGEEFVVLLPETDIEQAVEIIERIRRTVETHRFDTPGGPASVTFSAGLALLKRDDDCQNMVTRADRALYEAKRSGRNRTVSLARD